MIKFKLIVVPKYIYEYSDSYEFHKLIRDNSENGCSFEKFEDVKQSFINDHSKFIRTFCTPVQDIDNKSFVFINYRNSDSINSNKSNLNINYNYFKKYFMFDLNESSEKINDIINKTFQRLEFYAFN